MVAYLNKVKNMSIKIKDFKICQIPKEENRKADALANLASAFDYVSDRSISLKFLPNSSIEIAKTVYQTKADPTWMDDIITFLYNGSFPLDKLYAHRIQYQSARFCLLHITLYKRSFLGPLLRCLWPNEANYVLREIHEGHLQNHSRARSLVRKAVCKGYFWPQMKRDAMVFTWKCDKC